MVKEKSLRKRIEAALYQRNGFRYQHPEWDKKIWSKSKDQIREYLLNRFENTMDVVEYYSCMCLLYHTVKNKQLLVEFKDSPQYKRYWKQADEITMKETPKTSTEIPISSKIKRENRVNQIQTITVIGGE